MIKTIVFTLVKWFVDGGADWRHVIVIASRYLLQIIRTEHGRTLRVVGKISNHRTSRRLRSGRGGGKDFRKNRKTVRSVQSTYKKRNVCNTRKPVVRDCAGRAGKQNVTFSEN